MWLIFTGFLCAAYALQVPKRYNQENLILGLIYAWFCLYMIFTYIPITLIIRPCLRFVQFVSEPTIMRLPRRWRSALYALFVLAVIVITVFSLPEQPDSTRVQRLIALFGMVLFLAVLFASSTNHKAVNWFTVSTGMLLQFLLALFVFRSKAGHDIFQWASTFAEGYLGKSSEGIAFVTSNDIANSGMFAVTVFPAVIFFCATVQMLYYFGAVQYLLTRFAVVFVNLLKVSGAEAIVAVASVSRFEYIQSYLFFLN